MKLIVLLVFCLSFIGLSAQDFSIPQYPPSLQHEHMIPLIGKWKSTYSQELEPDKKVYGSGFVDIYFILNGRYMVVHNKSDIEGVGYESFSYIGWDKVNSEYFLFRFDNIVMTRIHLTGKYNEKTKTFTFEGNLFNEDKNKLKVEYQIERDNKLVSTIYLDEGKGLRLTYREILIKQQ